MVELAKEGFEAAKARGEARLRGQRAESAHYDAGRNRIIVRLTTGIEIGFAPRDVEGLQHASAEDLKVIEVVNTVPAFDIKSSPVLCCDACEQP